MTTDYSPNDLVMDFVARSVDFVDRSFQLAKATGADDIDNPDKSFSHIVNSRDVISRFMEGSEVYRFFTPEAINRLANAANKDGTIDFFLALQQYVFVSFTPDEVAVIASQMAFAITPGKSLRTTSSGIEVYTPTDNSVNWMPMGTPEMENSDVDILNLLLGNPWIMPLVSLAFSHRLPFAIGTEEPGGTE